MGQELGAATALLFHAAMTETKSATVTPGNGLCLTGLWCYEFKTKKKAKAAAIKAARKAYLDAVKANGFKLGIKIRADQQVVKFSFAGKGGEVALAPDVGVTNELNQAFAPDPTEKWVGLRAAAGIERKATFPSLLHVCYKFTLEISHVVAAMPQPVPVVVAYGDQNSKFAMHHVLTVVMLSEKQKSGKKGIQTSISAVL